MASIARVTIASRATARHLWWSTKTTAAQIANALTRLSSTILITSPTVPENTLIKRVGSERPRADAGLRLVSYSRSAQNVLLSNCGPNNGRPPRRAPIHFSRLAARDLVADVLRGRREGDPCRRRPGSLRGLDPGTAELRPHAAHLRDVRHRDAAKAGGS